MGKLVRNKAKKQKQSLLGSKKINTNIGSCAFWFLIVVAGLLYFTYRFFSTPHDLVDVKKETYNSKAKLTTSIPALDKVSVAKVSNNCLSTFSSKILNLSFAYDSCTWKLKESLSNDSGVYSSISATDLYGHTLLISANIVGMGGNYPGCYKVDSVSLLENGIVRVVYPENNRFLYLTKANDYAIKGYDGDFGDVKFNNYFKALNSDMYPNANICWRHGGINTVNLLNAKENVENSKDIIISAENYKLYYDEFLKMADSLTLSIYSEIKK